MIAFSWVIAVRVTSLSSEGTTVTRASPKSRILIRPSLVMNRLSGLISRWIIPLACAAPRPAAIWRAKSTARATGSFPLRSLAASGSPSSNSATMYGECPFVPMS